MDICQAIGAPVGGDVCEKDPDGSEVMERAAKNGLVTRKEAVAFLRTSYRTLQRMEDDKRLRRCPHPSAEVLYKARDVLKLASALGREA